MRMLERHLEANQLETVDSVESGLNLKIDGNEEEEEGQEEKKPEMTLLQRARSEK